RKEFYINSKNLPLANREMVVVSGEHGGYDMGQVSLTGPIVLLQLKKKKLSACSIVKKIYRKASKEDLLLLQQAKTAERFALITAKNIAGEFALTMKFCDVDYQADQSMATFYYTAPSRVDFRELIKILNKKLQVYIKMHQIGLLEESQRMGSIGPCGKDWRCHTWSVKLNDNTGETFQYEPAVTKYKDRGKEGKFECYIKD
ncbi:MAG: PSP1 domain-containing protein, partial [Mucilaginibacter sp.]